jgi:ABC-type antimicrobial peptide transport system permease subunit
MGFGAFAVRGQGSEATLIAAIGRALQEVDPQVPMVGIQSMDGRVQEGLRRERLLALLGALFGALALLLVAIGLYGLLAGAVTHRTREIGIRLALGGGRQSVLLLFLRQGLSLVGLGLLAGLALGALLGRFLRGELYGVASTDPASFVAAACVLAVTSAAACLVPAVRASRTDPMSALRED